MDNFKFNFLQQGQLGSLNIDNDLVTSFLHLLLKRSVEIILILRKHVAYTEESTTHVTVSFTFEERSQ